MKIQAYISFPGILTITAATLRPEESFSTHFTAAKVHEDFCARVMGLMEEHKHIPETGGAFPASLRLPNWFPASSDGSAIYAVKQIHPSGIIRDINQEFMLEITRIRYEFRIDLTRAAFSVGSTDRYGILRAVEYATQQLLETNGVPMAFVPGDNGIRPSDSDADEQRTEVDILTELGVAFNRTGLEIPDPIASPAAQ